MFLTANHQSIYYQRVGKGRNLVILHGWGQDVSSFWNIIDSLKENFTIWLIDLPGFGRSELPKKPFTVEDYAKTVKSFLEEMNIREPILLGHSLGGRVAIKVAAENPHIIDKLIIEDAPGIRHKKGVKGYAMFLLVKIFKFFVPDFFGIKSKLRHKLYTNLESDYLNAAEMKDTLTNILDEDLSVDLPKITTETLIIWGENDRAVPLSDGKKIYRLIPNSKLEVIENVGHFPHLENPERFIYYVKDLV